jgi:hypothetical protein
LLVLVSICMAWDATGGIGPPAQFDALRRFRDLGSAIYPGQIIKLQCPAPCLIVGSRPPHFSSISLVGTLCLTGELFD